MRIFILFLCLVFSSNAFADEKLTLEQAQKIALQNHPGILSSDFNTKAAGEEVDSTRAAYFPQISGNAVRAVANGGTRLAAVNGLNDPTIIDRGSAGISASQLITDFGKTGDLVDASKLKLEAQKQNANLTRELIVLNTTRAYYNLLRAKSLQAVAEETLKARKNLFDQISSLRDAKMKSDLDLNIAQQVMDEGNLLLLKAKSGVDDANSTLAEAMGYSENKTFDLVEETAITPPPGDVEDITQQALAHNPELASLKADKEAADKLADAEDKEEYPTVSALGYAGVTPIRSDDQPIDSNYATAGLNISIPFYTGGKLTAEEHKARYKASAAEQDMVIKKNLLVRDIHIAFNNAKTAYENIAVSKQMEKTASAGLDLTRARYDLGKSSIVDLSQAQLNATEAQIASTNSIYEYLIQRAVLDYQMGK